MREFELRHENKKIKETNAGSAPLQVNPHPTAVCFFFVRFDRRLCCCQHPDIPGTREANGCNIPRHCNKPGSTRNSHPAFSMQLREGPPNLHDSVKTSQSLFAPLLLFVLPSSPKNTVSKKALVGEPAFILHLNFVLPPSPVPLEFVLFSTPSHILSPSFALSLPLNISRIIDLAWAVIEFHWV